MISKRSSGFLLSSLDGMRPMPGDAIVVPEDLTRTTLTKDLKDWTLLQSLTAKTNLVEVIDAETRNLARRFYRTKLSAP